LPIFPCRCQLYGALTARASRVISSAFIPSASMAVASDTGGRSSFSERYRLPASYASELVSQASVSLTVSVTRSGRSSDPSRATGSWRNAPSIPSAFWWKPT
jgi:hypothetical protein